MNVLLAACALLAAAAASGTPPRGTFSELQEAEIAAALAGPEGFERVDAGPLIVLTQVHGRRFAAELEQRVELLQGILERDIPLELAEGAEPPPTIVVRLYRDQRSYLAAGGGFGTNNFVDAEGRRFLLFDTAESARRDLWPALAGLQFKAHWVRVFGLPWPHGWMLHGHEDYYAGFELKAGRLLRAPNAWRLEQDRWEEPLLYGERLDLGALLRNGGPGYSGLPDLSSSYTKYFAAGWSFVWFLRSLPESPHKPDGWQPAWELIIDRYLAGMRTAHDRDAALDAALEGIDLQALEAAWRARFAH
jgi:hypothetical protein